MWGFASAIRCWMLEQNFCPVVGFHSQFGKQDVKFFFVEEY